ncbi:hypothetical protein OG933_43305 [Streptomyces sp. NBC_00016]|uniref:hypothetical protein n=1 Tax=Streptomyces sp. NBC_00016 TaxID=2975622 RepID=UPI00324BC3B7
MAASYNFAQDLANTQDPAEIPGRGARQAKALIVSHAFWGKLTPADVPAARAALRHDREQKTADASG